MSHDLEVKNGVYSFAFTGDRNDIWHKLGNQADANDSTETWAKKSGLNYPVIQVPAYADLSGPDFAHLESNRVQRGLMTVRGDTGYPLGYGSERRKEVQPIELLEWFDRYRQYDSRFKLSAAGVLKSGERIWATAEFSEPVTVGGDAHKAYLLMTTAYDGSHATTNQASLVRTVCRNTLMASMFDTSAVVKTRHSSKFDGDKVARELAKIVQSVDKYRAMGDAMVQREMAKETIAKYFKKLLDIPFDAKADDVSPRKLNQFEALGDCYRGTVGEGTPAGTQWAALNAVTRYVDHGRSTRGGNGVSQDEARMLSAQFGSGAQMKAEAVRLLTADEEFAELLKAPFNPSGRDSDADLKALIAATPLRTR